MRILGLVVLLLSVTLGAIGEDVSAKIKVDQVGYQPASPKIALVTAAASKFEVHDSSGVKVYEGALTPAVIDPDTRDSVQAADFSNLKKTGQFYVEVPGVGRSAIFSIAPDVYSRALYLAARAFYGQRCGTAVDLGKEFPGFSHPACHKDGEFDPSSGKSGPRSNIGGWHDAGDYGRYLPTSGITTASLLWSWELFAPSWKPVRLNIPETGNGTPDILNEARWNLEWMLKMQDEDGGVWHKQTSTHFSGFVPPEADTLPSVIIGTGKAPFKSTCATADLAATAAIAARIYRGYDAKFADRNLQAAKAAWGWTEKNPDVLFRNPEGISTGEYGDTECTDERLWAAAELFRTTGDAAYAMYFEQNYSKFMKTLESPSTEDWRELAPMGLWSYALTERRGVNPKVQTEIRDAIIASAKAVVERTGANAYRVSMRAKDYAWGSNGVVAGYGRQLLVANAVSPDPSFVEAAKDNLHYLLGRNAFGLSWVTQLGSNPYRHPHHRPSGSDNNADPWPGLLSGGPNANRQDAPTKSLPDLPPARIYVDDQDSYASNEIAINWQGALVFLLAGVQ
ncbi:MAG TPA: glycoside hydrolase family 9 protein [Terriglobales bacterium]